MAHGRDIENPALIDHDLISEYLRSNGVTLCTHLPLITISDIKLIAKTVFICEVYKSEYSLCPSAKINFVGFLKEI